MIALFNDEQVVETPVVEAPKEEVLTVEAPKVEEEMLVICLDAPEEEVVAEETPASDVVLVEPIQEVDLVA